MDLEVIGRHALLFDDDSMAAFVNTSEALVEWNSLSIDRYDVRHLLTGPLPPRLKRRPVHHLDAAAASLEADLDYERYLDLPSSSSDEQEQEHFKSRSCLDECAMRNGSALFATVRHNGSEPVISGGYNAVAFSYGNSGKTTETKNNDTESGFHPHFSVPESLLQNLPPNEKVHQIIARTAMFVSKHGDQSEIILRVKQGDNPKFGFLMPDHHLHPYFRFLVDHQELLEPGIDDGNSSVDKNESQGLDQTGGALSLLGSIYGTGEDEDGATEKTPEFKRSKSEEAIGVVKNSTSQGAEQAESFQDPVKKDGGTCKNSISTSKEKVPVIKRNHSINSIKAATTAKVKKADALGSLPNVVEKSLASLSSTTKIEQPIVEPPSDLKRVIEKIVEFIFKNGKEFEAVLAEQDRAHGRFPFLVPSNQYHPYYLKVLQNAQEPKLASKGYLPEKHNPVGRVGDKKSASKKESDNISVGSVGSDIPYDIDRKEKFKMVIGKSKKDGQEPISKDNQPQVGVSMDAAAAAAILQAATRGIKNPCLEIFTKTSSGNGQGLSSYGSLHSSQPQSSVQKSKHNAEASVSVPVAKVIAETAAIAAAGEADSSEACMSKEQKLKAERLKRAKMFAAMIKSGTAPPRSEPIRGLSVEPPGSGMSGLGAEVGNLVGKEREGSSVPFDVDNSDKSLKSEEKLSIDSTERRSKRKYRSRSSRHEEEEEKEDEKDHKRSRRKHRSHRSSHSRDRHKHKRRDSSSKDKSAKGTKHDSSSDDNTHHPRHFHTLDSSSDEKNHTSRRRHRRDSSLSDNERKHSQRRRKDYSSSDDEHRHRHKTVKRRSRSHAEREAVYLGESHVKVFKKLFVKLRAFKLRLNPNKCVFNTSSGKLLGFIVGQKGIEHSFCSSSLEVPQEIRPLIMMHLLVTVMPDKPNEKPKDTYPIDEDTRAEENHLGQSCEPNVEAEKEATGVGPGVASVART
ncbi:splicing factor, suppressor of white-apricot-like protein isoform X1 [Senna tora]|uniref:Splicing factor, suppressor of white-apricot-like protein isoform X1 n=1 Tax=Senna tora TaxID=362788 RepID=A0A834U2M1_9FABA|nr:splicing factor, suppressor of white-apricot-like protein isoform X1 [Senna tora]